MDTENIDDPFMHAKVGEKVIVGPRSMMVFSDSKEVAEEVRDREPPKRTDPKNPNVPQKGR
jgi:hypothetical protein